MVFGDAAGPVSQLIRERRYRPWTSHGVSLRLMRTRVKRYLGRDRDLSYRFYVPRVVWASPHSAMAMGESAREKTRRDVRPEALAGVSAGLTWPCQAKA